MTRRRWTCEAVWHRYLVPGVFLLLVTNRLALAQLPPSGPAGDAATPAVPNESATASPNEVEVEPVAADDEIAERLTGILEATDWFTGINVFVEEGIVFLRGETDSDENKQWAGSLASKTQDVVAVVNQIDVRGPSIWDFSPALAELNQLGHEAVQAAPLIGIGIVLLILTWFASKLAMTIADTLLRGRIRSNLLRQVAVMSVTVPVFLIGLYLVLRVSGLTQLAVTVIGGTGLFGLVLGIAFRDIAENFLASVLISMQRPFQVGDLVEIEEHHGFVQRVTLRGTLLMTLDGNHIQIPNSKIYKSTIYNFTANPNRRLDFTIGIGYDDTVAKAQSVAMESLKGHPAVLNDPAPMVLCEELGASTVNLRIYFWLDGNKHSWLKVKSSVIRVVKRALEQAGVSMPDESREVIFPSGVPVRMLEASADPRNGSPASATISDGLDSSAADEETQTDAEGGFESEAREVQQQAERSRSLGEGENLLVPEQHS